jgi:indolepyruvate ferredoxin oxidoreductase beta subunit
LPQQAQRLALEGARRTLDYQDRPYAEQYLSRVERVAALDQGDGVLTAAVARSLALWMSFEDTIRVADLKTRSSRFARVREEVRAESGQLLGITDFMKPRVQEIAGTLPAGIGQWLLGSPGRVRWLSHLTGNRQIRTSTVSGFLLLHCLAGLRRWRRGTLRYREENARIEAWLARIEQLAPARPALAAELARAQRLIKGYGETHERGLRSFETLFAHLDALAALPNGAALLARLQEAALADEDGAALAKEVAALRAAPLPRPVLEAEPHAAAAPGQTVSS